MSAAQPLIAIVGRPNAGKSTLFNRLVGRPQAIVEDTPGVTRDRLYGRCEHRGVGLTVIDTGGLDPEGVEDYWPLIREQAQVAIDEADAIIFVTDVTEGCTPLDEGIATLLRKAAKPVILAVNKVDSAKREQLASEFYRLGFEPLVCVSAEHGLGAGDLLDEVFERLGVVVPAPAPRRRRGAPREEAVPAVETDTPDQVGDDPDEPIKLALVGRPNVGKSSLINRLLGEERLVVADAPGTTRDAIDSELQVGGRRYTLIDTAGLRRKRSIAQRVEKYAVLAAVRAIERADVAVVVLDASQSFADQDAHVLALAEERGCALIVLLNKWDRVPHAAQDPTAAAAYVAQQFPFVPWAPVLTASARTGLRVTALFDLVEQVVASHRQRVPTGELNRFFQGLLEQHAPPIVKGVAPRLYYITQAATRPPTFVISARHPEMVAASFKRMIVNAIRRSFGFGGSPIRLVLRRHDRGDRAMRGGKRRA